MFDPDVELKICEAGIIMGHSMPIINLDIKIFNWYTLLP